MLFEIVVSNQRGKVAVFAKNYSVDNHLLSVVIACNRL
jgi:hypothetical protein